MIVNQGVLVNFSEYVTTRNMVSDLFKRKFMRKDPWRKPYLEVDRVKVPLQTSVQSLGIDSSGDVY